MVEKLRSLAAIQKIGFLVWACVATPTFAQETIKYEYDALGRLINVERDRANTTTETIDYEYDAAANRTRLTRATIGDNGQGGSDPASGGTPVYRIIFNGRFMVIQTTAGS
ncbi:RHS repeat protein [Erythrobacter ani]|uniref:RHS repeat protein n=1 Tax=Erythrobacter ani TaxID=2827235 RepID=A0ABS6SMI4_9SPHN|nr:RHS repeat protein [Erythrobacter ani]MBV7266255.1 RHS repeat protein [Erythrobacter ani]